tara:strand:- start:383 stop:646 length:264 start_codon:yes stop_codon:yes gene_type:complete
MKTIILYNYKYIYIIMSFTKIILNVVLIILAFLLPYIILIIGGKDLINKIGYGKMTLFSIYLVFLIIISLSTYRNRPTLFNILNKQN